MRSDPADPKRRLHTSCLPYAGWYVASYVMRLVPENRLGQDDPNGRFKTWENTILVRAKTPEEAWEKTKAFAAAGQEPYRNEGEVIHWIFEGISELLAVYEELEDGAEIMWADHAPRTLSRIRRMVYPLEDFVRYADEA